MRRYARAVIVEYAVYMESGVCKNFEIVQDSLAFWLPSYWLCVLCLLGAITAFKVSAKLSGSTNSRFVAVSLFLLALGFFHIIQSDLSRRAAYLERHTETELIGEVSNLSTEYHRLIPEYVSFKVGERRFKSDMSILPLQAGNRCNWIRCGLRDGDIVRVTPFWNINGFASTIKIERCTDKN